MANNKRKKKEKNDNKGRWLIIFLLTMKVQFSLRKNESPIKRFTYSPNNLFCFDFELDLISKSRKQGFKSYSYYDFFFAVILKDGSRIITLFLFFFFYSFHSFFKIK